MILIDAGCTLHGYQSDISRTWVFGQPTPKQREVWDMVKRGQEIALETAKIGVPTGNIDKAVRAFYESKGWSKNYALPGLSHRTGHGIGMDGHENPFLVRSDTTPLAAGMCFSDEPGLYIPGEFGIRLEDCWYMTEQGRNCSPSWRSRSTSPFDNSGASLKYFRFYIAALAIATCGAATARADTVELPGERAFPENPSTQDGTLYWQPCLGRHLSGRAARKQAKVWIKPGTYGTHSVFGVLADDKSDTLWVCSNDLSARGVTVAGSDGVSALKGFDLKTGEGKISAELPGKPATCNDITIGPDGAAYVSNTAAPQILRLAQGGKQLEVWFTDPSLQPEKGAGLDGLAFGPDGNLYVDRYTPGDLYRINVKNGKAAGFTKLNSSRPLALTDAIRRYGKDQFLVVEGVGRLAGFTVKGDNVTVETLNEGYSIRHGSRHRRQDSLAQRRTVVIHL